MNKKEKRSLDSIALDLQKLVYLDHMRDYPCNVYLNMLNKINREFETDYVTNEKELALNVEYKNITKPLTRVIYKDKDIEKKVDEVMDKREKTRAYLTNGKNRFPKGY